jgi:hypothetical protein
MNLDFFYDSEEAKKYLGTFYFFDDSKEAKKYLGTF